MTARSGLRAMVGLVGLGAWCACGPAGQSGPADATVTPDALTDHDHDGYPVPVDCDDDNRDVHPGADEICDDLVDNDCDGDVDGDDFDCLPPCEQAVVSSSYMGCEFVAVDLPQHPWPLSMHVAYGLVVSNPSPSDDAHVTFSWRDGVLGTMTVPARGANAYRTQDRSYNVGQQGGVTDKTYRITSDRPVAVYQFNGVDGAGADAATSDASLLFPSHTLSTEYFAMTYHPPGLSPDAYIGVYATEPDTQVTITPTTTVLGPRTALLQPFEVLMVHGSSNTVGLTGSRVQADKPIGVFSGNACTYVPPNKCCCDHLEQQMFPRQAMGRHYVVAKTRPRTFCDPPDYLLIMADRDGTTIHMDPPLAGPWTLNAGEFREVVISASVELTANQAFLVGQFMQSSGDPDECRGEGDPAFTLEVPLDQYRRDYTILAPSDFENFVALLAPPAARVEVDGSVVALDPVTIGGSAHSVTWVELRAGPHTIDADEPVGVMVFADGGPMPQGNGYNSYAYPGGLDLRPINPVE